MKDFRLKQLPVRCTKSTDKIIHAGKIYTVLDENDGCYKVTRDGWESGWIAKSRFLLPCGLFIFIVKKRMPLAAQLLKDAPAIIGMSDTGLAQRIRNQYGESDKEVRNILELYHNERFQD